MIAVHRRCRTRAIAGLLGLVVVLLASVAMAVMPPPTNNRYLDAEENIFLRDEVTEIYITIDPQDLQDIYDDPFSDDLKVATVRWKNSVIDTTLPDVGVRLRGGNFTRGATRKSWKLDINDFVPNRKFHGLESINLNGEHNDPTLMRRMMAHEFHRRMDMPFSRTHHAALYINGDFVSIVLHTEHVDDEFVDSWFRTRDGNLYKCVYKDHPADLVFRPAEDYDTVGNGRTYEETRNAPNSDYTDLRDFIRFINQEPDAVLLSDLVHSVSIDNFLRYLASNVAIGSWDDYWYGSNNYYLYSNPLTNRFEFIAYDYDNSFGMDYFSIDWSTRHFENWGDGGFGTTPAPLVEAVFSNSEWRRQYRRYLIEAIDVLRDPEYQGLLAPTHAMLLPWFDGTIESGGTTGTQSTSGQHNPHFIQYNEPASYQGGSFHTMGLIPFMNARADALEQQIAAFFPTPPVPTVRINEVLSSNIVGITDNFGEHEDWIELYNFGVDPIDLSGWHLSDDPTSPTRFVVPAGVTIGAGEFLVIWADSQPEQTAPGHVHANFSFSADGEAILLSHNEANGRILVDWYPFPALFPDQSYGRWPDATGELQKFITPTPGAPNQPDSGTGPRTPPRLFINEFMASNLTTIADRFGEFDDWVEIYNDEDDPVDMGGMFLTDNLANPAKWRFPDGVVIPAKGFLLVWADNQEAQTGEGELHAAFALAAAGESLGLFDNLENEVQPIHTFSFGAQAIDISMGLLPDGGGNPVVLSVPTPGFSNVIPASVSEWRVLGE